MIAIGNIFMLEIATGKLPFKMTSRVTLKGKKVLNFYSKSTKSHI